MGDGSGPAGWGSTAALWAGLRISESQAPVSGFYPTRKALLL